MAWRIRLNYHYKPGWLHVLHALHISWDCQGSTSRVMMKHVSKIVNLPDQAVRKMDTFESMCALLLLYRRWTLLILYCAGTSAPDMGKTKEVSSKRGRNEKE